MTEKQLMMMFCDCRVPRTNEDACSYYYKGKCIMAKDRGWRDKPCPGQNEILRNGILDKQIND